MSLDVSAPAASEIDREAQPDSSSSDPTEVLRAAWASGARRVHLELSGSGMRIRSRIDGRLQEIAHLPLEQGRALADLLTGSSRNGAGVLMLAEGSVTLPYRLANCKTAVGCRLVLTPLPCGQEQPVEDLNALGAPAAVSALLSKLIGRRNGLLLVAGPPGSGRERTLRAIAGELACRDESLLAVSYGTASTGWGPLMPALRLDLDGDLWTSMERVEAMDADSLFLPEIGSSRHASLALALSGARRLGLAAIRAQDAAGAVAALYEFGIHRQRLHHDLAGVIAQYRLPRPCSFCSARRPLSAKQIPEDSLDPGSRRQLLTLAPGVRGRGRGCARCQGAGYMGWTYIYEGLEVDEEVSEILRSGADSGELRETLKAKTACGSLLESAWCEVLRGALEPEEIPSVPRPEVVRLSLPKSSMSPRSLVEAPPPQPAEEARIERDETRSVEDETSLEAPALYDTGDDEFYESGQAILHAILARFTERDSVELEPLENLAAAIVTATDNRPEIIAMALTGGSGDDLASHQLNVATLAVKIALGLAWERGRLERLALAALVHDVGLLRLPLEIVQKKKKLSRKEEAQRQRHPEWGEQMIREAWPELDWLPQVVRQVHERESGQGFPDGLAGDRIAPLAKVIGLADVLETLTHPRPRQPRMTPFDALQHLLKQRAGDFDRQILRSMVRGFSFFPVGSLVRLNNGGIARVMLANQANPYRPEVEMLRDAQGKTVEGRQSVDLRDAPFLYITEPLREELQPAPAGTRGR